MSVGRFCLLFVCTSALGCSPTAPSGALTGTWVAPGARFLFYEMSLQQTGDRITGVACAVDSGVLLFKNVPVQGNHPRVRFEVPLDSTAPCCARLAGVTFSGKVDDTGDIVGSSTFGSDLRFERSSGATICGT